MHISTVSSRNILSFYFRSCFEEILPVKFRTCSQTAENLDQYLGNFVCWKMENRRGRDHTEDPNVDRRIILEWILGK
jgi:hypothetical protein